MVKMNRYSVIEIWSDEYINNTKKIREKEDENAVILQIERGSCEGDYIVEILRSEVEKGE